jgi:hypothetical protein
MLALTDRATGAIQDLTEPHEVTDSGGLRIAANEAIRALRLSLGRATGTRSSTSTAYGCS